MKEKMLSAVEKYVKPFLRRTFERHSRMKKEMLKFNVIMTHFYFYLYEASILDKKHGEKKQCQMEKKKGKEAREELFSPVKCKSLPLRLQDQFPSLRFRSIISY